MRPGFPRSVELSAADRERPLDLYARLDVTSLDDAYGACCAAHSDGSDTYVTFPASATPERTIRVSDGADRAPALRDLLRFVAELRQARLEP